MKAEFRLMVVGSEDWEEDAIVHRELSKVHDELGDKYAITLVTAGRGGHGRGAEAIAINVAADLKWDLELYPPDYTVFGQSPYLTAIAEMVDTQPELCLAFIEEPDDQSDIAAGMVDTVDIKVLKFIPPQW